MKKNSDNQETPAPRSDDDQACDHTWSARPDDIQYLGTFNRGVTTAIQCPACGAFYLTASSRDYETTAC